MQAQNTSHRAFVSHAHVDNDVCDRFIQSLRQEHLDVWYDRRDMQHGPLLSEEIEHQLQQRTAFIMMMTEASLRSFWVRLEFGTFLGLMARDSTRVLIPVKIGPCDVPPMMEAFAWIDATTQSHEETIAAVVRALRAPIAAQQPPPPIPVTPPHPVASPQMLADTFPFLPAALRKLGFTARTADGWEAIMPPLCDVFAGPFHMGADKSIDPLACEDEEPRHSVHIDAFRIARFPVTVAEYACAVRAKAVREPRLWSDQLGRLTHPVTYVSWDDALQYAQWLAQVTNEPWRLPTEAEWEKAARWDELMRSERIYPWGDTWEATRANTNEANRHGTTPVETYPFGTSPCGAMDMGGNVWEWCTSLFQVYPYRAIDGREDPYDAGRRVMRGGSWYEDRRSSRCANRKAGRPTEVANTTGFRLACSGLGE